jgi:hypothetical protein
MGSNCFNVLQQLLSTCCTVLWLPLASAQAACTAPTQLALLLLLLLLLLVACRNPVKPAVTYLARVTSGYAARGSRQLFVDNVGRFKAGQWVRLVLQDSGECSTWQVIVTRSVQDTVCIMSAATALFDVSCG